MAQPSKPDWILGSSRVAYGKSLGPAVLPATFPKYGVVLIEGGALRSRYFG